MGSDCGPQDQTKEKLYMNKRKTLALVAAFVGLSIVSAGAASAATITGAGSSLVNPIVQEWIPALGTAFGYQVTYASVGSGTGIADISAGSVDFGASDAPMTTTQAAGCSGCIEVPWVLSATTLSYNVPGVPNDMHLNGAIIADIYEGKITNWNDPRIAALNPNLKFPNLNITPVHRSDGSGDTYAFTNYLSDIESGWAKNVGYATSVTFPVGPGASGNAGVAALISSTPGSIGYISAAYTLPNHLTVAAVKNAAGQYELPGLKEIEAAAAAFTKQNSTNFTVNSTGVELHIVDPPKSAKDAYPLSTYSNIIFPKTSPYATELRHMIFWALTVGNEKYGPKLIFAPTLPKPVLSAVEKTLAGVSCPSSGCA
jgi:phosphate transport system substrate-binding protein